MDLLTSRTLRCAERAAPKIIWTLGLPSDCEAIIDLPRAPFRLSRTRDQIIHTHEYTQLQGLVLGPGTHHFEIEAGGDLK